MFSFIIFYFVLVYYHIDFHFASKNKKKIKLNKDCTEIKTKK
ncbi:hypothetical protein ANACAC_00108 [Anaerostipes caccae L1-92]|uniref:Uncharacterized protein n=1 Tax=Anaerostipes caccae (strain DSM 14662 / CCUG 47493 / JCM 13470 / NCIMB 13811 / L1-92) TaxID=411490 RepID=B0M9E5_ANACD|nr:hypothetical protein ANACAC_00108 [Anaerostipes caccae L1-92]